MKKIYPYLLILAVMIALATIPLIVLKNAEFEGTDDKAITLIQDIDKNYHPWFEKIKIFQSQEIISTFFAIQAAIGAGILGYYIGYSRGKQANQKT